MSSLERKVVEESGKKIPVWYLSSEKGMWIHFEGESYFLPRAGAGNVRSSGKSHTPSERLHQKELLAPMPGKVTKILAQMNVEVAHGQPIIVMEAMKMEYTIKSGAPGVLKEVRVKVGEQVSLGQLLAVVE